MISLLATLWGLNIWGLVGIIFFIVVGILASIFNREKSIQDPDYVEQTGTLQYDNEEKEALRAQGQFMLGLGIGNKKLFQDINILNDLHKVADIYFIRQTVYLLIFTIVAWLVFFLSLAVKHSVIWSFVTLLYGLLAVASIAYAVLKVSINMTVRFLNESQSSRGKAYSYGWGAGSALIAGIICLTFVIYADIAAIAQYQLVTDATNKEKQQSLFFGLMGFVWAVVCGSFFYRQIGMEIGKGLVSGSDMLSSVNIQNVFNYQQSDDAIIKQGQIFGNILSSTLTQILDFISIYSTLVVIFGFLVSQSKELLEENNNSVYYYPIYALLVCVFVQVVLQILPFLKRGTEESDEEVTPATFTAKNNFLVVLLTNLLTAFVLVIVTLYFFPNTEFSIGSADYAAFYYEKITSYSLVWCVETGVVTQSILMFIGELFTSNAFNATQHVSQDYMRRCSNTQLYSISALAQSFILLLISVSVMVCYLFGGFFGIACGLVGILSTPVLVGTITLFGTISYDATTLAKLGNVQSSNYICSNMAKGAMNYQIYMQITNATAIFYVNVILIGLTAILGNVSNVQLWDAFSILGIFLGGAFAYYLKASSNFQILKIARVVGLGIIIPDEVLIESEDGIIKNFENFIRARLQQSPVLMVIINTIASIMFAMIVAYLFGARAVLGFITGLNLFGVHMTLHSVMISNCARNARYANQDYLQKQKDYIVQKKESDKYYQGNLLGLQNSIVCDASVNTSETNGLIPYLLLTSLFIAMGAMQFWKNWGQLANYLEGDRSSFTDITMSFWEIFVAS